MSSQHAAVAVVAVLVAGPAVVVVVVAVVAVVVVAGIVSCYWPCSPMSAVSARCLWATLATG